MRVVFKGPVKIDGTLYAKGAHVLPEKHADHWYVKAMIQSGHAQSFDGDAPAAQAKAKPETKKPAAAPKKAEALTPAVDKDAQAQARRDVINARRKDARADKKQAPGPTAKQ